ncbi:hypothetical protein EZJ49_01650 [Bdellovibrio bacteriovorus]|uniref:hypothetical protein n=1 Tax=Bdellovibrio bacteriovorus TaxID=959 RepID=UPI0021CFAC28|nr:hypothetical protein [Bdellovibrio bacteriovorus]UXR64953.1 hypothetical protein EZJ49_01650 [Bdellovibrio bacteriovorus]
MRFGLALLSVVSLWALPAQAGKVESVQELLMETCKKKVSYEQALVLIRPLYLTCVPGTKVAVGEKCQVKCLKPNAGAVIGR